jgi:hypothetical protein
MGTSLPEESHHSVRNPFKPCGTCEKEIGHISFHNAHESESKLVGLWILRVTRAA